MHSEHDPIAGLIEEYVALRRAGRIASAKEFAATHSEHAGRLLEVLRAVEMMEAAGPRADSAWSALDPLAGASFGDYRIVRELGRGGMGVVYEALHLRLGRRVALKILKDRRISSAADLARFQREAGLASKLDHPHICTVYETGEHDGDPFIAMRLLEGETLASRIARAREGEERGFLQLPSSRSSDPGDSAPRRASSSQTPRSRVARGEIVAVARLIEKVARALHVAHQKGVVHRDVKPANIMVGTDGEPVVMDFGLARDMSGDDETLTRTGQLFGTPAYMPPEQILGRRGEVDRQSDVYSLGVTLYESLTLRRPFEAPTREALYRAILVQEPSDPRSSAPALPSDLAVVVLAAMEKSRGRRYPSALALAEDLRAVIEHRPISVRPVSRVGRAWRWARRQPAQAALILVLSIGVPALAASLGFVVANLGEVRAAERATHLEEVESFLESGFVALGERRWESAGASFERAIMLEPGDPIALAGLAFTDWRRDRATDAIELLERDRARTDAQPALERLLEDVRADVEGREPAHDPDAPETADALSCFLESLRLRCTARLTHPEDYLGALSAAQDAVALAPRARALYHFEWAIDAAMAADEEQARRAARSIVSLWPDSARAWFCVGFAIDDFDPEAALRARRRAIELDPHLAPAYQGIAHHHLSRGELDLAWEAARRAVEKDPTDALLHNTLGLVELYRRQPDSARQEFEETLRLEPRYAPAIANLAQSLMGLDRDLSETRALLERGLEVDPEEPVIHMTMSALLERTGDLPGAVEAARRACEVDPGDYSGWAALGRLQIQSGSLRAAEESLRRGLDLYSAGSPSGARGFLWLVARGLADGVAEVPVDACLHADLAFVLEETGRPEEAAEHLDLAADLAGTLTFPHVRRGRIDLQRGELRSAEAAFRRAIEIDGRCGVALGHLGTMLLAAGNAHEALPLLEAALEIDPSRADVLLNLGVARHFLGEHSGAVEAYSRALEIGPRKAQLLNNYGLCLIDVDRPEDAREVFEEALAMRPTEAEYHDNMGVALWKLGRLEEAIAEHRRAVELDPGHSNAHHKYANRLRDAGEWSAWLSETERWTDVEPDEPRSWKDLVNVLLDEALPAELRDPSRALQAAEKVLELGGEEDADGWELLACAQFAAGEAESALETLEQALALLPSSDAQRAKEIEALREQWRATIE